MAARKKVRTYEDVFREAVLLSIRDLKSTNQEYKNSDPLLMTTEEIGDMVKSIVCDLEYRSTIDKKFEALKKIYLANDEYDGSAEEFDKTPSGIESTIEEINFGF